MQHRFLVGLVVLLVWAPSAHATSVCAGHGERARVAVPAGHAVVRVNALRVQHVQAAFGDLVLVTPIAPRHGDYMLTCLQVTIATPSGPQTYAQTGAPIAAGAADSPVYHGLTGTITEVQATLSRVPAVVGEHTCAANAYRVRADPAGKVAGDTRVLRLRRIHRVWQMKPRRARVRSCAISAMVATPTGVQEVRSGVLTGYLIYATATGADR